MTNEIKDKLIAAIHREESPVIISDLAAQLWRLKVEPSATPAQPIAPQTEVPGSVLGMIANELRERAAAPERSGKLADDEPTQAQYLLAALDHIEGARYITAKRCINAAIKSRTAPANSSSDGQIYEQVSRASAPELGAQVDAALADSSSAAPSENPYAKALTQLLVRQSVPSLLGEPLEAWAFRALTAALATPRQTEDGSGLAGAPSWKDRARYDKVEIADSSSAAPYMAAELADWRNRFASGSSAAAVPPSVQGGVPGDWEVGYDQWSQPGTIRLASKKWGGTFLSAPAPHDISLPALVYRLLSDMIAEQAPTGASK